MVTIVEVGGGATFGDHGRRTLTAANGRFVFQQLSSGRYRVDVEKSGFAPSFDPFESKTLTLGSGESITSLRVALERGGVVAGGIRNGRGEALPQMTVFAMRLTRAEPGMGPELIQGGVDHLALDLSKVDFMDSSSLGSLVTCLKRIRERDGKLVLVGVGGTPMKVLTLTGLDRVFDIVGSTSELPAG